MKRTFRTHPGVFHADDVMGGAILWETEAPDTIEIIRSARPVAGERFAFDIGGGAYDHHQEGGNGVRPNGVKYAAAGLLWRDFGKAVYFNMFPAMADSWIMQEVVLRVDETLIQSIDAQDNGQRPNPHEIAEQAFFKGVVFSQGSPVYEECAMQEIADLLPAHRDLSFSDAIAMLRPSWHEGSDMDAAYHQAVELARIFLRRAVQQAYGQVLAENEVTAAAQVAGDSPLIVLERWLPWDRVIVPNPAYDHVRFVVSPSQRGGWQAQAVSVALGMQRSRLLFPEAWRVGPDAAKLQAASGIADLTFCHIGGFILSGDSREGVVAACTRALQAEKESQR